MAIVQVVAEKCEFVQEVVVRGRVKRICVIKGWMGNGGGSQGPRAA